MADKQMRAWAFWLHIAGALLMIAPILWGLYKIG